MPANLPDTIAAAPRLIKALASTPVVLVHGPRQCGKTKEQD